MTGPTVSVVMSVYNNEATLEDAVESILSQDHPSFEFVIIDDGSTDSSAELLSVYARNDPRIRLFTLENRGLTKALMFGCAEATGDFIARQDADDVSLERRLSAQATLLDTDESLSLVGCSTEVFGPGGELLLEQERFAGAEQATADLLGRRVGPSGHGSVMFRKSRYQTVGGYRAQLYYSQDADLWLRLASVGRVDYVPRVLYRYRVTPDSMSGRLDSVKRKFAAIVDELHALRLAHEDEGPVLERAAGLPVRVEAGNTSEDRACYFIARCLLRRSDKRAAHYLIDTLRRNPLHLKAWLSLPEAMYLRIRS